MHTPPIANSKIVWLSRYIGNTENSTGAVAGGVVAALTLAYQEAKQGPWMARGFVQRFLDCGGAVEVKFQAL